MQFTVERDEFNEAVSFAVKLLPQRPTQPILSGILITSGQDKVEFATFDYETSAKTYAAAEVATPGQVLVSGRLLADIASKLPPAPVNLSLDEQRVTISCGSAKFSLAAMPVEEYPQLPVIDSVSGTVDAKELSSAIAQVVVAASKDDVTPVITGVQFEISVDHLTLTATDRYRVATRSINWQTNNGQDHSQALIPARIVAEIGKTFGETDNISVTLINETDRELVAFSDGKKIVTSLLIKGNYPPVQRLFPENVQNYAIVSTQDIADAVGRVGLVLEREAAIKFNFTEGQVSLEGVGQESAQASEVADCHLYGDEMTVSLKPQFLLDGLRATHSEYARIGFTRTDNPNKPGPVLITGQTSREDADKQEYRYLLQPNLLLR